MAFAGKFGIGVAVSAVCSGLILFGPLELAKAHRGPTASRGLFERATCAAAGSPVGRGASTGERVGLTQALAVSIPRTAVLRVDHAGHVVAAMTNTGCAPRPGDDLFYARPDGSLVAAPASALANRRWVGNFTMPGVYASQTTSTRHDDLEHAD